MHGIPVSDKEIATIRHLRETSHSLPEIRALLHRGNSTVFKYIRGVKVLPEYRDLLREKQGGSRRRSQMLWQESRRKIEQLALPTDQKNLILLTLGLYWAEGNKRDLSLINSDPDLIRIFVRGLRLLGAKEQDFRFTLRLYEDIDESMAKEFWMNQLSIEKSRLGRIDWLDGKKKGKLLYGMCRVRVARGGAYFKLLLSGIEQIKNMW